jgi:hypothetical protein
MAYVILPPILEALHGKVGDAVYVRTKSGTVLRRYVRPRNPSTPAQQAVRASLKAAAQTYKALTPEQAAAWQEYARTRLLHTATAAHPYTPAPFNAFMTLALKYLQLHPGETPPLLPPEEPFFGEGIRIVAEAAAEGIVWTASAENTPTVATELLAQRLTSLRAQRTAEKYRTQAFVTFTDGALTFTTPLGPALYAPAYRFVHQETGQATKPTGLLPVLVDSAP